MKFPILVSAAYIYHKKERSDVENKILISLLNKLLTLGDWLNIGTTLSKTNRLPAEVIPILKEIVIIYHKNHIVNWRNDTVGHGALAFDVDTDFKDEIEKTPVN